MVTVIHQSIPIWILALFAAALAIAEAEDWKLTFEEKFEGQKWTERWNLGGSVGPRDKGALRNGGGEMAAWLKREFRAPAVRVDYTAMMEGKDAAGQIGDLSCMIGRGPGEGDAPTCYLLFGSEFNSLNRITVPGSNPVESRGPRIELGRLHRVLAEVNGRTATLTVDGKRSVRALLPGELPRKFVGLYAWCGSGVFKSVRVYTKKQADPVPEELKAKSAPPPDPPQELPPYRTWSVPTVTEVRASPVTRGRIPITVRNPSAYSGPWPVTMGVPFPKDSLWNINAIRLVDGSGKEVPLQAKIAATWTKGGSIRWAHLDFVASLSPEAVTTYSLEYGSQVRRAAVPRPVRVDETEDAFLVDTGALGLTVSKKRGSIIEGAWLDANGDGCYEADEQIIRPNLGAGAYFVTADGRRFTTARPDLQYSAEVESSGPIRTVIRARGWYQSEDLERACYFVHRLYLYRGQTHARLFTTWVVTADTDQLKFRDIGLRLPTRLAADARVTLGVAPARLESVQKAPAGMAQTGRHESFWRADTQRLPLEDTDGWLDLSEEMRGLTVCVYDMASQWPNALEAQPSEIIFHAFSSEGGHDLDFSFDFLKDYWGEHYGNFEAKRGSYPPFKDRILNACGLAKTHEMVLRFHGKEDRGDSARFACAAQHRPIASAAPQWVCDSGAVGLIHPRDLDRFPKFEEGLSKNFDQFLDVLDRLTPVYGFYDYGMGIPHYISPRRRPDGETEYVYAGYRREYDLGYGNPIVPWKLFLRSGDERYYRYAVAFSRHCMDSHAHHWTNPRLKKRIGWTIADHGSWVYDSVHVGFSFNNWLEYLLLNYYVNGYERAMDVAVQFMDALHTEAVVEGRAPSYCGMAGIWHGNAALMFTALWEEKYREVYEVLQKSQTGAWCRPCGGFAAYPGAHKPEEHGRTHRQGWREYGLYHGVSVPGHASELDEMIARLGETDLRVSGWGGRPAYATSGQMHWAAWQRSRDPRYVKFAQLRMEDPVPSLIGYAGLAPLRAYLSWMKLSLMADANKVEVPVTSSVGRFEVTPVFVKHIQGPETLLKTRREIRVTNSSGKEVTDQFVQRDEIFGESVLRIPGETDDGVYRLEPARPSQSHWAPFTPLTFQHSPGLKFMLGIPQGIASGHVWLFLPAGCKRLRVLVPGRRSIVLTFPDGRELKGTGPVWEASWDPLDRAQLALLRQEPDDSAFFKIQGVPAYTAASQEAAFEIDTGLRDEPPPEPSDLEEAFVGGTFARAARDQALQLNGRDRLVIPLGEKVSSTRRKHFEASEGTLEFFVRLNTHSSLLGAEGLPIQISLDPSVAIKHAWMTSLLRFDWKSTVMLSDGFTAHNFAHFGRWSHHGSPDRLQAGKWYHFAVIWTLDDNGRLLKRAFLNGEPDPMGTYAERRWWPPALKEVLPGPELRIGAFPEARAKKFDFALDELRVSDVVRYEYEKTSAPPSRAFEPDAHTLLLFHFDGDTNGRSGAEAEPVKAQFINN